MQSECTFQLHADGRWHDVASVLLLGDPTRGWQVDTYLGYAVEWAVERIGRRDAYAMSRGFPVGLQPWKLRHWPVFMMDMLPQSYGRGELLRQLGLPETTREEADWPLLLAGAGNPVGNLRIKEAAGWLAERSGPVRGFSFDEVARRSDDFMQFLSEHGLFIAGSSGVQGEWPKILLTQSQDGLLYLDHTLPDADAQENGHYIVKFGRGENAALAAILRHEQPYMAIAQYLGLRVHAPLKLRERALFIPRFDRVAKRRGASPSLQAGVDVPRDGHLVRLGQESLASLMGMAGFGVAPAHDDVVTRLAETCTEPEVEVLEYLRRDVANLAFGNKDNHARNTAIQRDFEGRIALTPLFDFAPMYMHPDGLARRMRWRDKERPDMDWNVVLDEVVRRTALPRSNLAEGLRALIRPLDDIRGHVHDFELEPEVQDYVLPRLVAQLTALERIR